MIKLLFSLIILILLTKVICFKPSESVGSVLFNKKCSKRCWNEEDLTRLRARMMFEKIIFPALPPDKITRKYNENTIRYFRSALHLVDSIKDVHTASVLKEALADTIGAHMKKEILPNARFAYYAGYVPYRSVRDLHDFFKHITYILNTQGQGWMGPDPFKVQKNITVDKILLKLDRSLHPCAGLKLKRYRKNCIYIPIPKVDDTKHPLALALPYVSGGFVNLLAPSSANAFLKYYTTATRCILRRSPDECRQDDFVNFNNDLWHWMKRYVAPHLMDDKLYAGYGGVLRVAAAVQHYGRGLKRRHHLNRENPNYNDVTRRIYSLSDQTNSPFIPPFWIIVILGVALAVCSLHCIYSIICGPPGACHCVGYKNNIYPQQRNEIAYANVDSSFPSMLPPQYSHKYFNETTKQVAYSGHRNDIPSKGTTKRDLNENPVMSMSDKESSESVSSSVEETDATLNKTIVESIYPVYHERSPRVLKPMDTPSPNMEKSSQKSPRIDGNELSTSTVTQSGITCVGQMSESCWSGSSSSTETSFSINSQSRNTRRCRDLAWAKKVVCKQKRKLNSITDPDLNSISESSIRR